MYTCSSVFGILQSIEGSFGHKSALLAFSGVLFVLEIFVRFFGLKRKLDCLRDPWFIYDFCLVVLVVVETWLLPQLYAACPESIRDSEGHTVDSPAVQIHSPAQLIRFESI